MSGSWLRLGLGTSLLRGVIEVAWLSGFAPGGTGPVNLFTVGQARHGALIGTAICVMVHFMRNRLCQLWFVFVFDLLGLFWLGSGVIVDDFVVRLLLLPSFLGRPLLDYCFFLDHF